MPAEEARKTIKLLNLTLLVPAPEGNIKAIPN